MGAPYPGSTRSSLKERGPGRGDWKKEKRAAWWYDQAWWCTGNPSTQEAGAGESPCVRDYGILARPMGRGKQRNPNLYEIEGPDTGYLSLYLYNSP